MHDCWTFRNRRVALLWILMGWMLTVGCGEGADAEAEPAADAVQSPADGQTSSDVQATPPPANPGFLGEHAIGHTVLTIADPNDETRSLKTQVWYPAENVDEAALTTYVIGSMGPLELEYDSSHAQRDVPAAAGPWPFVIFSHGYGGIATQSLDLCERLASHGFIVASPAHAGNTAEDDFNGTSVPRAQAAADRPRDVRTLIDTMTDDGALPELLRGLVDPERIGVTGHSFGGFTSLSAASGFAGAQMGPDPRVKAVAPICPGTDDLSDEELAQITVPVAFIGGTLDTSVPIDPHVTRPYALINSDIRLRVDVIGATHTHFANICTIGNALIDMGLAMDDWEAVGAGQLYDLYQEVCGEDAFPIDEAIRIQCHYVVAFFKTHLVGERAWEVYLSQDYAATCEPKIAFFSEGETPGLIAPECQP